MVLSLKCGRTQCRARAKGHSAGGACGTSPITYFDTWHAAHHIFFFRWLCPAQKKKGFGGTALRVPESSLTSVLTKPVSG